VYENLDSDLIDAFSPAAYVGLNASGFDSMTTAADVWASAYANFENEAMPMWRHWTEFATAENKRLVYYEGGQHFTPDPFRSDQPYNQLLQDLQTSSEMYALYTRLLDSLQALNQESLFMNFSFVGQKSGKYGSWGVLESQYMQPPFYNTAPKYQALLDFIDQGATLVENNWKMPATHQLHQNFPNPFNPQTNIRYKLKSAGLVSIRVFDLLGREIEVLINKRQSGGLHNVQFDGRNLASGIYFYSLEIDGKVMGNRKMILMK
ncbi:MAG: T9SS C-terminal target domain-containing protein, partial [Calditrichaeota bacterium]